METLVHADIFFFITAIAVVALGLFTLVALVYFIQVLMEAKRISKTVREEADLIAQDIRELRRKLKEEGRVLAQFKEFFTRVRRRKRVDARRKKVER